MSRYTMRVETKLTKQQVEEKLQEFVTKEGFKKKDYKGEDGVYKRGTGIVTAPQYIKAVADEGFVSVEGWIKPFIALNETGLDGVLGVIPKKALKARIEAFISLIQ